MSEEEKKDYSEENKKRMLVALAILFGAEVENNPEEYKSVPEPIKAKAEKLYQEKGLKKVVEQPARMPERQV